MLHVSLALEVRHERANIQWAGKPLKLVARKLGSIDCHWLGKFAHLNSKEA